MEAKIIIGRAAGNVYGTLTLQNISTSPCSIIGNNMLQATSSAKNVVYHYFPAVGQNTLLLTPNQTVYSKVHYPNGPQCQTGIVTSTISFSYHISQNSIVTFVDNIGEVSQPIITCLGANNTTQVDIWNLSTKEQ